MEAKFKIGDAVMHKSGGPKMMIEDIYGTDNTCVCSWFSKDVNKRDEFPSAVLQLWEDKYNGPLPMVTVR